MSGVRYRSVMQITLKKGWTGSLPWPCSHRWILVHEGRPADRREHEPGQIVRAGGHRRHLEVALAVLAGPDHCHAGGRSHVRGATCRKARAGHTLGAVTGVQGEVVDGGDLHDLPGA
jgi:hypothetical protein